MTDPKKNPRSFMQLLPEVRNGLLVEELTEKLAQMVSEAQRLEKPCALTLKLTVFPASNGGQNAIGVAYDVDTKVPKLKPKAVIMFSDKEGGLHRNDPQDLFSQDRLKEVKNVAVMGDKKARVIDEQTGEILSEGGTA